LKFFISIAVIITELQNNKAAILAEVHFRTLENWNPFLLQDVSLYIQTFQVLYPKTILPFLQKREKKLGTRFSYQVRFTKYQP